MRNNNYEQMFLKGVSLDELFRVARTDGLGLRELVELFHNGFGLSMEEATREIIKCAQDNSSNHMYRKDVHPYKILSLAEKDGVSTILQIKLMRDIYDISIKEATQIVQDFEKSSDNSDS